MGSLTTTVRNCGRGIDCLVFDAENFGDRAADLQGVFQASFFSALVQARWGGLALADTFDPAPLVARSVPRTSTVVYTGGTTGPKGVLMTHRVWQAMTWIQMSEWEFPEEIRLAVVTPLSHAALSLVAPVMLSEAHFM